MVTAALKLKDACSLEEKLWPESILKKQRHYFANKGSFGQSYGFPVIMYGCQSWTKKKAECQRIDAFKLRCCRRLSRVPWPAGKLNRSILKEINPEYSLKGLMLKLKLQYLGHLMWKPTHWKKPWCWEGLRAEKGYRGWDGWVTSPIQCIWVWANSGR